MKSVHKKVHKTLHLRHHKHTGKLLHHRHTSYRVLFLMLLVPIAMLAFVNHMDAVASDMVVTAKIPAPMPAGTPTIDSPTDGATINDNEVTVSGTCPVITPAIIISVTSNGTAVGSVVCETDGTYSVPINLFYGTNELIATVVTITDDYGNSSDPVTITGPQPPVPPAPSTPSSPTSPATGSPSRPSQLSGIDGLQLLRIAPSSTFVMINADGSVEWRGKFQGGTPPYHVEIDWRDGSVGKYTVTDQSEQTFAHTYSTVQTRDIVVRMSDDSGDSTTLHTAGVTLLVQQRFAESMSVAASQLPPPIAFIEKYVWQIYIATASAVVFLWLMHHGFLLQSSPFHISKFFGRLRRH